MESKPRDDESPILLKTWWPLYLAIALGCVFFILGRNTVDMDLWGLLSFGRLLETTGAFPYRDVFSFTAPNAVWIYHEWGCGVLFYQLLKTFGSESFLLLKLLLLGGLSALIYRTIKRNAQNSPGVTTLFFIPVLLAAIYLFLPLILATIRCHLFSYAGFAYLLFALESLRVSGIRKHLRIFPAVMLLWANLHGGYAVAFLLLGLYAIWFALLKRSCETKLVLQVFLGALVIACVNPYGYQLPLALVSAWLHPRPYIAEWQNVFQWGAPYGVVYSCLIALFLALSINALKTQGRQALGIFLLLAGTGVEGWLHVKMAPFFLISAMATGFALPLPAWKFPEALKAIIRPAQLLGLIASGLLLIPIVLSVGQPGSLAVEVPGSRQSGPGTIVYPQGAVRFIAEHASAKQNIWTPFDWGEYLMWTLPTEHFKVSLDGRYETLYPEAVFLAHQGFYNPPYAVASAQAYKADLVLTPAANRPLHEKLLGEGVFRLVYQDEVACVFAKDAAYPAMTQAYPNAWTVLDEVQTR